ncbi:condensin complex protein MksE [Aliagarivorans marinus]|uniref:condensin complex protein MksE n=1 Tax=Aliagarivorans marinus TaxID=561965 RepID=UPI00047B6EA9|nr:hypothetical protein [Aliagarivorans marinus]
MYDANLSALIFNELMNGKVINRTMLNNSGEFSENPLFTEVMENLKDYRTQYEMNGCEFVDESEFIFIRDRTSNRDDLKTEITMKACLLLLILGKYINENNYRLSKLTEPSGGITRADIEEMQEEEDTVELIEKAKLKNDLHSEIKNVLVNRNIMLEKPSEESYILSDAGRAFFNEVIANYV